ncbi:hypothetical protein K439DRAFT_1628225 [Ramaria rubella]|nr:hypothetical protein K439DRAFT_1628225 [Ramaria rubella]
MRFSSAIVAFAGLLAVVPSALATITIIGPSPNVFWVQNTSNTITWEFTQGDPNPITITITNPNSTFLNGAFTIADGVDLSNKTFTVTNVTLNVHPGYVVNFVNGSNITQIFASSQPFEVMAAGTPPASQPTASGSSPSATSTSPAGSSNGSVTSAGTSSTSGTSTNKSNASSRSFDGSFLSLAPMLGMSGLMAMAGALATL